MKRIFILIGVLALAVGVNAQNYQHSNYIGLNVNGGFNSMTYSPAMGDASLGLGFGAGLRYTHFFGTNFGVGLGVQFNHANASALYDFTEVTAGLTHDDNGNLTYDLHTVYNGWRERQTLNYLSVPVELYWRVPVSERAFVLVGVGAQFDMPLNAKYKAKEGSYENSGNFYVNGTPLSYNIEDMPNHGFRTYDADFESDVNITKKGISVIADLGFNYALNDNWGLYIGLYGGYGITNLLDSAGTEPMLKINEDDASVLDYNGTFASNEIDALNLLNFGLKLGVNLGWDCQHKARASKGSDDESDLVAYDNGDEQAKKDALEEGKKQKADKDAAAEKERQAALDEAKKQKAEKEAADAAAEAAAEKERQAALEEGKKQIAEKEAADAAAEAAAEKERQAALEEGKKQIAEKEAADAAAEAAAEKERQAALEEGKKHIAENEAAEDKAKADDDAERMAALEQAKKEAAARAAAARANEAYGNDAAESPEEAAAREARCNARRMNNPDMAQAMNSIDADLDEAEQMANASGNAEAKAAVADARAKAADAKAAHKNGRYCKAYDLFNEAYGFIADSYAADANGYADKAGSDDARKAATDAALYAESAHNDGLDCAMAASRNARINAEIARDDDGGAKAAAAAWNDPNYADYLANEALAMAEECGSKSAKTSAKDASGKAYRGNLADSYAACAKSFATSARTYAAKSNNPEAKAASEEADRYAAEAAEAARMGDVAAAYRAARAAQQAAERARRPGAAADNNAGDNNKKDAPSDKDNGTNSPADRAQLQQYLDQINATVHFDFSSTEPQFDSKTDLAIRALCAAMKSDRNIKVLITGHTDNVGSAESNMNYGQRRAEALKQLMVNQGAPAANISTTSKGQNEPVVDNDTDEHRHQNRRAVITLK